jgi:hypothetical protein
LKTITAQAWKLGVVGLAFVLAFTMLLSSTPSQTAQAAVGETTSCKMTITETDQAVLVDGAGFNSATVLVTIDETNTTLISEGTVLTVAATGEKMLVVGVPLATKVLVRRGHGGTIAGALANNGQLLYKAAATANSPKTCMGDTTNTMTVTVKSADAGQTAKVAVDRFTNATNAAQVVEHRTNGGTRTAATTTITLDSNVGLTANDYIVNSGTGEIVKVGTVDGGGTTLTSSVRGQMGTTAAAFDDDSYWTDLAMVTADFADANQIVPKINGLASRDTVAEEVSVALDTFTAATATVAAYYSGTFTLSSATAGEAVISVKGANSGPKYITDPDTSSNLIHVNFRGAPVSYKDTDLNGAFNSGDVARSTIVAPTSIGAASTTSLRIDVEDSLGQQLVGKITFNLSTAACDAGVTWSGSGKCDLVITTTNVPGTDNGDETVNVKGLATTGNFRYSYTATYSGASGDFDFANSTDAADMVMFRTNNIVSSLTSSIKKAASDNAEAATDAVQTAGIPAVANDAAELYYVEVKATDSAGNPAAASITVKDLDGDGTDGLGAALDISFEETGDVAVTKVTANAAGKALFWVRHATIYTASATDPKLGTYPLEFYYTSDKTIKTNITVNVRSAAKTFALAATSGQSADGSLPTGTVGTWTLTATDINGTRISADTAVTFIVTGMGTGATAGSFVPTDNALTVDDILGGVVSIVAPTVAGTGTIAVIHGGKVVASETLTFGAPAVAGSATVTGTGCTGSSTGSYTCVVTEGGTAAEVATASGAVSVWQSDADGVLQGYVVGTPDFVNTGLASDATIADNSAVIVVR